MREILLLVTILFGFIASAQKSYEFSIALPPDGAAINNVQAAYFGTYYFEGEFPNYEVNAAGIFLNSISIHSVSRDTIRESSKYQVKGDFIFGIDGYDSLPCILEDDAYYFGVPRREMLVGMDSKNQLKQISKNEYIISFEQNGNYIPCKLRFEKGQLKISSFDYPLEGTKELNSVAKKQEISEPMSELLPIVLMLPTQKEWLKMYGAGIFGEVSTYRLR